MHYYLRRSRNEQSLHSASASSLSQPVERASAESKPCQPGSSTRLTGRKRGASASSNRARKSTYGDRKSEQSSRHLVEKEVVSLVAEKSPETPDEPQVPSPSPNIRGLSTQPGSHLPGSSTTTSASAAQQRPSEYDITQSTEFNTSRKPSQIPVRSSVLVSSTFPGLTATECSAAHAGQSDKLRYGQRQPGHGGSQPRNRSGSHGGGLSPSPRDSDDDEQYDRAESDRDSAAESDDNASDQLLRPDDTQQDQHSEEESGSGGTRSFKPSTLRLNVAEERDPLPSSRIPRDPTDPKHSKNRPRSALRVGESGGESARCIKAGRMVGRHVFFTNPLITGGELTVLARECLTEACNGEEWTTEEEQVVS